MRIGQRAVYDTDAAKKPVNLSVNSDLLDKARALGVNLSQLLEEQLARAVREETGKRWLVENRAAIEAYNAYVEKHGVFSEGLRSF